MKAHILFEECFDEFSDIEIEDDIWMYDSGHVDVASTYVRDKYGDIVIPNIRLDKDLYGGPEFDWGSYFVFSPLFLTDDFFYNVTRYHGEEFVNNLIDRLFDICGDRLLIVTDKPELITNASVRTYTSDNLYDALYVVGNSSLFIGGQSGFMHFASLCKIPRLIAIYSHNAYGSSYYESHGSQNDVDYFEKWARVYTEMGQLKDCHSDIYPMYNRDYTSCNIFTLYNNILNDREIDEIIRIIEYSILLKKPENDYYIRRPTQDLVRVISCEDKLYCTMTKVEAYNFKWKVFADQIYEYDNYEVDGSITFSVPITDSWMGYHVYVNDELIECASKERSSILFNVDYYS